MLQLMSVILLILCLYYCDSFLFTPKKLLVSIHSIRNQFTAYSKVSLKSTSNDNVELNEDETNVFTQKQILKEETEAPFRKVRIFFYISLLAAAGLGFFICLTKIIALNLGGSQSSTPANIKELYTNFGINLGGIPVLLFLWRQDLNQQKILLDRIQKGGSLAGLKVKFIGADEPIIVKLSDLRRDRGIDKRVVIVVAEKELLRSSIITSLEQSKSIMQNDLVIIPLVIEKDNNNNGSNPSSEFVLTGSTLESLSSTELFESSPEKYQHIGLPVSIASWNNVIKREISTALKQEPNALSKGITIIIKKNGKVGTRRFGVPIWETLIGDVAMRSELGLDISNI